MTWYLQQYGISKKINDFKIEGIEINKDLLLLVITRLVNKF